MLSVYSEAEAIKFSNVILEWVDHASMIAGLRDVLGLELTREQRGTRVWVVR